MKYKTHQISLVAHVTIRGLESLTRGHIDLNDPRLKNAGLGTVQLELQTDPQTAYQLEHEIMAARALYDSEFALQRLDNAYILTDRVTIAQVTTGNAVNDRYMQETARLQGADLKAATNQ